MLLSNFRVEFRIDNGLNWRYTIYNIIIGGGNVMTVVVNGNETYETTYMCDCNNKGWS